MKTKSNDRIMISIRLPKLLLDKIEEYVEKNKPAVRDRTQAIEVALENLFRKKKHE